MLMKFIIKDYNSCKSGPCKNGATCSNIPDDYICDCSSGWSGKDCETGNEHTLVISKCIVYQNYYISREYSMPTYHTISIADVQYK